MKECKKCKKIKDLECFTNNKTSKDGKAYWCKECFANWAKENKEKINNANREWYKNNLEKSRKRGRDKYKKYQSEYLRKTREYKKLNKDKVSEYRRKRDNFKIKNDLNFRLKLRLRERIRVALKTSKKSNRTMELVGCSLEELKIHLSSKFTEGMSWDNYGKWHIDHIRPCASFDLTDPEQQKQCFHYTNLQPLWAIDNIKKSDKY